MSANVGGEAWLPVPGFEGRYSVSDHGRVRSEARKVIGKGGGLYPVRRRMLKQYRPKGGYPAVGLSANGRVQVMHVHVLVLSAFVCPRPRGMECCHWDGNPANNRVGNLRWDSRGGNRMDAVRHGRMGRGELNGNSKLSNSQADEIRASRLSGAELARMFNVVPGVITNIRHGRTYVRP